MKKVFMTQLLAVCIAGCVGCAGTGKADMDRVETETQYETLHLVMADTSVPKDEELVEEAISRITREKLQVNVDLHTITSGTNYSLYLGSSEPVDLIAVSGAAGTIRTLIDAQQLVPMDALLEQYGQGVREVLGETLRIGEYDQKLYGVSSNRQSGDLVGIKLLKNIVEKYDIDISRIKSWDDLDEVFEIVRKNEPDIQVVDSVSRSLASSMLNVDGLNDSSSGILDPEVPDSLKVVNLFETDAWTQAVYRVRRWYEKGYIRKEVLTSQESGTDLQNQGKVFACVTMLNLDDHLEAGELEKVVIPMTECLATSSVAQRIEWVIPAKSNVPQKAMQMLNLMYTDAEIVNLLQYGIEGVHYEIQKDGTMLHQHDVTGKSTYYREYGQSGNQSLLVAASKLGTDYEEKRRKREDSTVYSKAYGFIFDKRGISGELEAIRTVIQEYRVPLELGMVDPDTELSVFREKLWEAGIDNAIGEKQRQLDKWAENSRKKD
ncbi:MAG: ABC transporter substrate-binding protein [Lachnospiraceae bacterium]|jgi:putative aldouronate transport system substrate-binding protein|nr:ABC transporter substrate-binding protein [Lachnospiraceae bacterium]